MPRAKNLVISYVQDSIVKVPLDALVLVEKNRKCRFLSKVVWTNKMVTMSLVVKLQV